MFVMLAVEVEERKGGVEWHVKVVGEVNKTRELSVCLQGGFQKNRV
jgi:hypothetical protein